MSSTWIIPLESAPNKAKQRRRQRDETKAHVLSGKSQRSAATHIISHSIGCLDSRNHSPFWLMIEHLYGREVSDDTWNLVGTSGDNACNILTMEPWWHEMWDLGASSPTTKIQSQAPMKMRPGHGAITCFTKTKIEWNRRMGRQQRGEEDGSGEETARLPLDTCTQTPTESSRIGETGSLGGYCRVEMPAHKMVLLQHASRH